MATYYVATTGSDSYNGTSATFVSGTTGPWRTIGHAGAAALAPGDTVMVAAGTYSETPSINCTGAAGNLITFKSTVKWGAKVISTLAAGSSLGCFRVGPQYQNNTQGDYVRIQDFDVTTGGGAGVGIDVMGSYCEILGNYVHDVPCTGYPVGTGGAGIAFPNYPYKTGGLCDSNVCARIGTFVNTNSGDNNKVQGLYSSCPNVTISNNIVYGVLAFAINTGHAATACTIVNNTIFGNGNSFLDSGGIVLTDTCSNCFTNNNIIYDNLGYAYHEEGSTTNNTFTNNLVNANTYDYGTLHGTTAATLRAINPSAAPGFVAYSRTPASPPLAGSYKLVGPSSACYNTGTSQLAPAYDYEGNVRPQSGAYDIGAYEYVAAGIPLSGASTISSIGNVAAFRELSGKRYRKAVVSYNKQPPSFVGVADIPLATGLAYASSIPYEVVQVAGTKKGSGFCRIPTPGTAASPTTSVTPYLGKTAVFGGSSAVNPLQVTNCLEPSVNGAFSFVINFRHTATQTRGCLISFGGSGTAYGWALEVSGTDIFLSIGSIAEYTLLTGVLSLNTDYTLVVSSASTATAYVVNRSTSVISVGSAVPVSTLIAPTTPLSIGAIYDGVQGYADVFAGHIGSYAVWGRALSANESYSLAVSPYQLWQVPAYGSFVNSLSRGVGGAYATPTVGSNTPSTTLPVNGNTIAGSIGTITAAVTSNAALTGNTGTGAVGSVSLNKSLGITAGSTLFSYVGAAVVSSTVGATGNGSTTAVGTAATNKSVLVTASGVASGLGSFGTVTGAFAALSGSSGSGATGSVSSGVTVGVTGINATATYGSVGNSGIVLIGNVSAATVSSFASAGQALSGNYSTCSIGSTKPVAISTATAITSPAVIGAATTTILYSTTATSFYSIGQVGVSTIAGKANVYPVGVSSTCSVGDDTENTWSIIPSASSGTWRPVISN